MTRILWSHPEYRLYRKGLFECLNKNYQILFFFQLKPSSRIGLNYFSSVRNKIVGLNPLEIHPKDLLKLLSEIYKSDIFVSSFIRSGVTIWGLLVAKIIRRKVIVWEEWYYKRSKTSFLLKMKDMIGKFLVRFVDAFFVLGPQQKKHLISMGVNEAKIFEANEYPEIIYYNFPKKSVHFSSITDSDSRFIIFIGRLIKCKGVEILIRAFSSITQKYPNVYLLIVGDGPLKPELITLNKNLGNSRCLFLGEVTDNMQKSYLFHRASFGVIPSIETEDNGDPGPLVTLELLSSGLPLIVSERVGNIQHIENCPGCHRIKENSVEDLSEKIELSLNLEISKYEVFSHFKKIKDYEWQASQFKSAIIKCLE